MKTATINRLIPIAVLWILIVWILYGCTEEVIMIEKEIVRDTVTVDRFIDRYMAGVDTVEITTIVEVPVPTRNEADTIIHIQYDTIFQLRIDTVWRERVVFEQDTVVQVVYQWGDTLIIWGGRDTYSVPAEVMPIMGEFYREANAHGFTANGGEIIIEIVPLDDVLQAYSFEFNTQVVIRINDNLTNDERFLPLFRELARWQLGKEYSQTPGDYMYPFTAAHTIRMSSTAAIKEQFWNEIQ